MALFAKRSGAEPMAADAIAGERADTGILPIQSLSALIDDGAILADEEIDPAQLQPASLAPSMRIRTRKTTP